MFKKFAFTLLVILFFIITSLYSQVNVCYAAITKVGQLIFIEGTVQIKRANTTSWIKAEEFDPLYNNDEIKTLKNSTAEIEFTHGDIVLISSSSHFKIQNYNVNNKQRIADFFLSIGKTWASVKKAKGKGSKFKINTPVGAASVRGTLFVVEVLPKELTKPSIPENLEIIIAAIDGKIDIDTQFDKKILNPLKEVNFTQKDQKLIIQNIKPAYLNEANTIMQIINQLQNRLINEVRRGENINDQRRNAQQQINILDYTKVGQIINQIQQNSNDSDSDGLPDVLELRLGSNPNNPDTDGDSMTDKQEYDNGLNIIVADANDDPDNDGMTNIQEIKYSFNPHNAADGNEDTDSDGLVNATEIQNGLNPRLSDIGLDTDSDDLPNILEVSNGSDPKTANPDVDEDNISNAFEVQQSNLGFPMNPFTKSLFSDKVDSNYKTINSNYAAGSVKKIDFTGITDALLADAATIGDGIGDFDEIILKDTLKTAYNINDSTDPGKKLLLDPTYYNLAEIVKRVKEYKDLAESQKWNDLDSYSFDANGMQGPGGDPLPALTTLYNPKNWNLLLIVNLAKKLKILDESFALFDTDGNMLIGNSLPPGKQLLNSKLTNKDEDIGGLLFGIYKIMDPDGDYIKNADEEFINIADNTADNFDQWHVGGQDKNLDPLVEDKLADFQDLITMDKPIYIISLNNSLIAPFTGQLIVNDASSLTQYPNALVKSDLEFLDGGITKMCPNNKAMLKYPLPGQSGKFIYICPRDPGLTGDILPPGQ